MDLKQLVANLYSLADDIQREADGESLAASQGRYGESAGIRRAAKQIELELSEANEWPCINCGLPTAVNPHPDAGKPSMMNWIGVVHVCVPCAEKRANGRRMLIERFRRWLEAQREATCGPESNSYDLALGKLEQLKEWFRRTRCGTRSPDYESAEEPPAYRWKKGGLIWRIVARSRNPGYVIAEANDGSVASFAESVFLDPDVVEPLYVVGNATQVERIHDGPNTN